MGFGWRPLTDTMQLSSLRTIVPGQLAQGPAVTRRAHDLEKGLDPMVPLPTIGKAEVIDLFADGEEIQAGFLAHEAQADPRVGPSATDGLGNAAVVGGQPPGGPSVPEEFIEALPCPGPVLTADPPTADWNPPPRGRKGASGRVHRQSLPPSGRPGASCTRRRVRAGQSPECRGQGQGRRGRGDEPVGLDGADPRTRQPGPPRQLLPGPAAHGAAVPEIVLEPLCVRHDRTRVRHSCIRFKFAV